MNWIFEHFQIVIAILAAVAYMFKRGQPDGEATGDPGADAERSRKIREEIQRKIAERRAGEGGPVPQQRTSVPPPVIRPQARTLQPVDSFGGPAKPSLPTFRKAEPTPPPVPQSEPSTMAAVLERQEQLAAQMRALERARAAEQRRAAEVKAAAAARKRKAANAAAASAVTSTVNDRDGWLEDLRTPQGLRRAIVQREILGPPVALR